MQRFELTSDLAFDDGDPGLLPLQSPPAPVKRDAKYWGDEAARLQVEAQQRHAFDHLIGYAVDAFTGSNVIAFPKRERV